MTADSELSINYKKYNAFISETLEPRLKDLMDKRDDLVSEIESHEENIFVFEQYQYDKKVSGKSLVLRKLVDVGCGVACQAESTTLETVFVDVGIDTLVEFSLSDAINISKERQKIISDKIELLDKNISLCVTDIESTLSILAELKKLDQRLGSQ